VTTALLVAALLATLLTAAFDHTLLATLFSAGLRPSDDGFLCLPFRVSL
jgi:hypothetical protein